MVSESRKSKRFYLILTTILNVAITAFIHEIKITRTIFPKLLVRIRKTADLTSEFLDTVNIAPNVDHTV